MTSFEPDSRPGDATAPADGSHPPPPQPTLQVGASDRRVQRLIALVEVVLCSDFPTQILLTQILILGGLRPFVDGQLSLAFVVTLSLVDAAVLIVLILSFLWIHRERPRDLFLGARPIGHESMAGMFLIPVVILGVLAAFGFIEQFAPWLRNVPENPLEALIRSRGDAWLFGTVSVVAGGVREEMQRAFILRRFEQHLGGGVLGLVVFSLVFGAGHLIQGWDAAVITTLLGAFWGATYLIRRSIIAPVVSHSGFNITEIIRYLAV